MKARNQPKTNMDVQSITKNVRDITKILKQLFPEKLFKNIKQNKGGFWKPQFLAMTAILFRQKMAKTVSAPTYHW